MSDDLKNLIKNLAILFVVLVLAYFFANQVGSLYAYFFPQQGGGGGGLFAISDAFAVGLMGIPLSYIFFLALFFTAFGGSKKYWWMGILLIPAVVFEVYFDLEHIYFPIILGLAGWLLGFLVSKIISASK
ncbi:MAG: hypothetical protein Q8R12_01310 [bacterium]|nr:hypothetical protein [bacterium]